MALDFAGLKAAVRALSPAQVSTGDAGDAVNRAYQTLLGSRPGGGAWFGLKKTTTFTTKPDKTAGTITLVQGSDQVVGVGTAWDQDDVNRFLVVGGRVPLRIESVQSATELTLQQSWGEAGLAATTYQVMSLRYLLPSDADRVTRLAGPIWPLARRALELFDAWDPLRQQRGSPLMFAEAELLSANSSASSLPSFLQGTETVPAGSTSLTVSIGNAGTSGYQVTLSTSWNTSFAIRAGRTATEFTVDFGVPAPAAATLDWMVSVAGATQGATLLVSQIELELMPVPDTAITYSLEYKKRVEDLSSDSDVPVLAPQYVMHASRVEMCMALAARTGDQAWFERAKMDEVQAQKILDSLIKEDRRMRGAHPVAMDSDDLTDPFSADWWRAWRMFSTLAGGRIA